MFRQSIYNNLAQKAIRLSIDVFFLSNNLGQEFIIEWRSRSNDNFVLSSWPLTHTSNGILPSIYTQEFIDVDPIIIMDYQTGGNKKSS